MIAIDTNILVYAHRDSFPLHAIAARRLRELAEGPVPWALPIFCIGEFCRVVTHSRVLSPPSSMDTALLAIERLLAAPSTRLLLPGETFVHHFETCVRQAGATGNLVFDAQIAAVCREHGVNRLLTADRDFARFAELEVVPLNE